MNKVFIVIVIFAAGALCGYQFSEVADKPAVSSFSSSPNSSAIEAASVNESPTVEVAATTVKIEPDELITQLSVRTPKTQFERYRAFQKLDLLSVAELEELLMSIDDSQLELKKQVAWFFSGKFPEPAFDLMESSMGDNQMPLAQILYENLTNNHPEKVFDWLQNNENDFVMLYPVAEQQFESKMALFQALSVLPDWKWAAYEAGLKLVKDSMRPQDSWSTEGLAYSVAQTNPMDAINYALAQHDGAVDKRLLHSAVIALANTDPVEAKKLLIENQAHLDQFAASSLVRSLMARGEFNEIYSLADSLTDKKMIESVVTGVAGSIHKHGSEKVVEYIATIDDSLLKVKAVNAAANSMSVAGYPVEKVLDILDGGLRDVPVREKVVSYALTIKRGYKDDPQAMAVYLNKLKMNDKELAVKVEQVLNGIKDS